MKHKIIYFLLIALQIVIFSSFSGASADGNTISVVATTGMIGDIIENIGGDRVNVQTLMGAGVDPHLYKASEGDVMKMADADIIFFNGLHLEAQMGEVMRQMEKTKVVAPIAEAIPAENLLKDPQNAEITDPHVWFDVQLWITATNEAMRVLIEFDPDSTSYYEENGKKYLSDLEKLDAYVHEQAQRIPEEQRILITAHDAFNYFGRAYGFEVRGLQGISTVTEAGAMDVRDLISFIVERGIKAMFIESSVPQRNIEAVMEGVQAKGGDISIGGELFSDAMGDPGTFEGTYQGMVTHNIDTIVSALLGE